MMRYWDYYGNGMGFVGPVVMGIFFLLLIALIVVVIVSIVRASHRRGMMYPNGYHPGAYNGGFAGGTRADAANALTIASERYAKGEISEEEYLKIKENLSK